MDYIKQHRIHLLFEKLAGALLASQPEKPISFLIEQLQQLQGDEDGTQNTIAQAAPAAPQALVPSGPPVRPKATMSVFGLDKAGKTTLVSAISGEPNPNCAPTIGFSPCTLEAPQLELEMYDLGGGKKIRGIWSNYYADLHGIIFVVDSADQARFEEAKQALADILADERAKDKPLLIFANKQDMSTAATASEVERVLGVRDFPCHHVFGCSAIADPVDENIEYGMQWAFDRIAEQYENLNVRIKRQMAEDKAVRKQKQEEQRLRVEQNKKEEEAAAAAAAAAKK